jgi:adenylate kinase family enzyme
LIGAPYQELDALFHGPDWTELPGFVEKVTAFTDQPTWVCEYQYIDVRAMLADRADTMVFLDYPRRLVMWRVIRRTVSRRRRREPLWNGNEEGPLWRILLDDEHIIRWAWKTHRENRERLGPLAEREDLTVVALRSPAETERWLAGSLAASLRG